MVNSTKFPVFIRPLRPFQIRSCNGACLSRFCAGSFMVLVALPLLLNLCGCSDDSEELPSDMIAPAAIVDLAARVNAPDSVILTWTSPGDDGIEGKAAAYDVRYSTLPITDANWSCASQVSGEPFPRDPGANETLMVAGIEDNDEYYFAAKSADETPNWSALSNVVSAVMPGEAPCWRPIGSGIGGDAIVFSFAGYDDGLAIGGAFETAGCVAASGIVAYQDGIWTRFGSGVRNIGWLCSLFAWRGKLIAGGNFEKAGDIVANNIAAWDGIAWRKLGPGTSESYDWIEVLQDYGEDLIAGGSFYQIGGKAANNIGAWNTSSWRPLGAGLTGGAKPDVWPLVEALALYGDQLIVGGYFGKAGDVVANNIAAWNGTTWSSLGVGIHGEINNDVACVHALASYGDLLIVGGRFANAGGNYYSNSIAAWNGSIWSKLDWGIEGEAYALAVYKNKLIVAGDFSSAGGIPVRNIAAWDGASWWSMGYGFNGPVYALTVYNDQLIAGGVFTEADGARCNRIAVWQDQTSP